MTEHVTQQRSLAAIMFTDMVGFSALAQKDEALALVMLEEHNGILRSIIPRFNGREIETAGDSFFVEFASALEAVQCAVEIQRTLHERNLSLPAERLIRIRIGLHLGDVVRMAGSVHGDGVNIAARLEPLSAPGGICVSEDVARQIRNKLEQRLLPLGEKRLKNISLPVAVYAVELPWNPEQPESPPHRPVVRPSLPLQITSFVGREQEREVVAGLLHTNKLVTMTGPGGTGKTRLSLAIAADIEERFADGVAFVPLANITDPNLVAPTIAQVLGLRETPGREVLDSLVDHLRNQNMLLVLDNFEQITGAGPVIARILAECPGIRTLVTSRVVLYLTGEQEFPVPPLLTPDVKHLPSLQHLSQYAAVELFIQRARAVQPDFNVTNENAPAIAEICHQLDGLPLAIELAAARIKLFTPQALLKRMGSKFDLLKGASRDIPERHQTLRNVVAWSYGLLTDDEKAFFRRLSVFVGGCSIEAAERVIPATGNLQGDPVDLISALVDRSLLRRHSHDASETRFFMLETIREFGLECLVQAGEDAAVRSAHMEYYLELVEAAAPELTGHNQKVWLDRLETDHDNIRAALQWAHQSTNVDAGLRLGASVWRFWIVRGHMAEGIRWLESLITIPGAFARTKVRAQVLNALGTIHHETARYRTSEAYLHEALGIWRELDDRHGLAVTLNNLGWLNMFIADYTASRAHSEEALTIHRELGDKRGVALAWNNIGWLEFVQSRFERSLEAHEQGLALRRELGDERGVAFARANIAWTEVRRGNFERANRLLNEAQDTLLRLGDDQLLGHVYAVRGELLRYQGDTDGAEASFTQSFTLTKEAGNDWSNAFCSCALAVIAAEKGDLERSRCMLEESLNEFSDQRQLWTIGTATCALGLVALRSGDLSRAERLFNESLATGESLHDIVGVAENLAGLAELALAEGRYEDAAGFVAASRAVRESVGAATPTDEKRRMDAVDAVVRDHVPADRREAAAQQAVQRFAHSSQEVS